MSDEGEKTCPLCAEEMDLTDQQLRPCKCGYEICVWCWHHIMDMAEKDNTEGRCPACRTPYNKEKIVGTASKCERSGMIVEKKQKSQKGKTKTCEARKQQLGSVRVIQRNLVYIVGLPLNLADEDILQQKEYFGQYGKVLKVSISRTTSGGIQQFANSTCSVYITYSKEEEAIRSIQSTHGFVLEGRTLRACFGTTKYCHAWLRNTACTNVDCLYLHEFGLEEDSFTKDEIITAYTRVQQITGVTNDIQRRSGNLLPPPIDNYNDNNISSWPKLITKTTTNQKVSLSNSSSGKSTSTALPAAASWGTRASNSQLSFKEADVSSNTVVSPEVVDEKGSLGNLVSIKEDTGGMDKNIPDKFLNSVIDEDVEQINKNERLQPENVTKQSDLVSDLQKKVEISEAEENKEVIQNLPHISSPPSNSTGYNPLHAHVSTNGGQHNNMPIVNDYSSTIIGNSSREVSLSNGDSYFNGTQGYNSQIGALDLGESSIISNILSMDFDPWDESLTSPTNLAKFLGESNKHESHRVLSSRKTQNSNQSRFSFARENEESNYGDFDLENNNNSIYNGNSFSSFRYGESENKNSVSRTQVSAPPGFSGPSRAPPPGFTSQERIEQTFDTLSLSGNHMFDMRKSNQSVNIGGGDLEFMDPAIMAVGGRLDMRSSNFHSFENDVRLQLLKQTSFSQQNPRFIEPGLNYPQQNNSYRISSNNLSPHQQTSFQQPRSSLMSSNGHWNSWNNNDISILRNGFNRYYSGHETSGDLYNNRTFGI